MGFIRTVACKRDRELAEKSRNYYYFVCCRWLMVVDHLPRVLLYVCAGTKEQAHSPDVVRVEQDMVRELIEWGVLFTSYACHQRHM